MTKKLGYHSILYCIAIYYYIIDKGNVEAKSPSITNNKTIPTNKLGRESNDEKMEFFDEEDTLIQKLDKLAGWVRESHHCIFFTGAGISTSAGIPDFRSGMNTVLETGPGAWELRDAGKTRDKKNVVKKLLKAVPTYTHLSIVKLQEEGRVKYVVSQNVDGLHLRSGLDPKALSELHGNTNLETCAKCKKKYLRDFRTRTAKKVRDHKTGRLCADPQCRGALKDSIVNFGENLPQRDLNRAYEHAEKADLCICMGSSLTVSPANEIPEQVSKRKQRLVICNLQKTPLHRKCDLPIYAMCDDVMRGLMERLGIPVGKWMLRRRARVEVSRDGGTATGLKCSPSLKLRISGLDLTRELPYSIFQKVVFTKELTGKDATSSKKPTVVILEKEPFELKVPFISLEKSSSTYTISCALYFHGHYAEESAVVNLGSLNGEKSKYDLHLVYDLDERAWQYEKRDAQT